MPQVNFGAASNVATYGPSPHSDGIGLPTGRAMANGSQAVLITALGLYVSAQNSGHTTATLSLGSAACAVSFPVTSSATYFTGLVGTNAWLVQGGTATVTANSGTFGIRYAWGGGGSVRQSDGVTKAGTLAGAYYYVQAPTAPTNLSAASSASGTLQVNFSGPADNGESGITDYVVEYATDAGFTTNFVRTTTTSGSNNYTGLLPTTYYVRVAARNAVTNAAGTWSVYSASVSVTLATVPTAPTAFTATAGERLVHFAWTPASNGGAPILDYNLQIATNAAFSTGVQNFTVTGTSRSVVGLSDAQQYWGKVLARNVVGNSSYSTTASATTPARTFQDTVGTAAVHVLGGAQVELRSDGGATPVITLVYSTVTGGTTVSTIATVPTGTTAGQFATPGGLDGLALVADSVGNLYVIGVDGSTTSSVLVQRYLRTGTTNAWTASGALSQALTATENALVQFAGAFVNSTLFVITRRAGATTAGNLSAGIVNMSNLVASSGSLFSLIQDDPSYLPSAPTTGAANGSSVDAVALSDSRCVAVGNGFSVFDVASGVVTPVAKSANGTDWSSTKLRVVPINSTTFAVLRSNVGNITVEFYNTTGSLLSTQTVTGTFTDEWDAGYNRATGLLVIEYMSAARTLSQITISATTYVASSPATLTATMGAASTTNTKVKLPRGVIDERHVLVTAAGVASGTQSQSAYSDTSGNLAPSSPGLTPHTVFDSRNATSFAWTFGDPNIVDSQSAYQLLIDNATTGVSAYDSTKTTSTTSNATLAASAIANGVNYRWRVRTWDLLDSAGSYSSYGTFTTADAGNVTITTPSADNPASALNYQDIVWSYSSTSGSTQVQYRVRVLDDSTGVVYSDTGFVASTATTYRVTNLLSGVVQRVEVTIISTSGLTSAAGTRKLTPSYSAPETPLLTLTQGAAFIGLSIINPVPTGSRPPVVYNEVWKKASTDSTFRRIAQVVPNGTYNDYATASGVSYSYYVRATAVGGQSVSTTATTSASLLQGVWIHNVASPSLTIAGYFYGNKSRTESVSIDGTSLNMLGRRRPVIEFGINEKDSVSLKFMIPAGDSHDDAVDSLRTLVRNKGTLCYRDNRARVRYGAITSIQITDAVYGSDVTATFTVSNYTDVI